MMKRCISFYKFVAIKDLEDLRATLKKVTHELNLRGTILIAPEGINAGLAGSDEAIQGLKDFFENDSRFAGIEFKFSDFEGVSFRRMLVKIKKEIITMGVTDIDPLEDTGHYLRPSDLKKWYDENKEFLVVDTRNDYEFDMGTFDQAINPKIKSFGEFPKWVKENLSDKKDIPVVTFCTGGVRCEKATAFMKREGFKEVYQLEGGILKYFEEFLEEAKEKGQAPYWQGDCIVFDKRKAVQSTLEPTTKDICYCCLGELTSENRCEKPHPAGEVCIICDKKMRQFHAHRVEKGMEKQLENLKRRKSFLSEVQAEYQSKGQAVNVAEA